MKFLFAVFLIYTPTFAKQFILDNIKLNVTAPKTFKIKKTKENVILDQNGNLRAPEQIKISVFKETLPNNLIKKVISSKSIDYVITPGGNFSGGTEFTTTAYENTGTKYIRYEHRSQIESLHPDLKFLWEVVASTKVLK